MVESPARVQRHDDSEGAVAIVVAITLTVLLLFAALAVDLGLLRADRSGNQLVADMAVTAGAQDYEPQVAGTMRDACQEAKRFAETNLGLTLDVEGDGCDVFHQDAVCTPGTPIEATFTGTDSRGQSYKVRVTNPVLDSSSLMGEQAITDEDGAPCERLGVSVSRERNLLFGGITQIASGQTRQGAVATVRDVGEAKEFASLIVLDPSTCTAIRSGGAGGDGGIYVDTLIDGDGNIFPGTITVDTELVSGCPGGQRVFRLSGSNATIRADSEFGRILSSALTPAVRSNPTLRDRVYSTSSLGDAAGTDGLWPVPEFGRRVTRQPVDHPYNCMSSYPSDRLWSPNHPSSLSTSPSCEEGTPAFLRDLHAVYIGMNATTAADDPEWGVLPDPDNPDVPDSCSGGSVVGSLGPDSGTGATQSKWYIDCPGTTGNNSFNPSDIHFDGVKAVVTRGPVELGNDTLGITGDGDEGGVLFQQSGDLEPGSQSVLRFENLFVYLETGRIDVSAGADVQWEGPIFSEGDVESLCQSHTAGVPPAACFSPLALWTNSTTQHNLGGGGDLKIVGSFFTPNALFRLRGNAPQNLDEAQFFAGRLDAGGSGILTMTPNPESNIAVPISGRALIR